jgi:hypothetical protein
VKAKKKMRALLAFFLSALFQNRQPVFKTGKFFPLFPKVRQILAD